MKSHVRKHTFDMLIHEIFDPEHEKEKSNIAVALLEALGLVKRK